MELLLDRFSEKSILAKKKLNELSGMYWVAQTVSAHVAKKSRMMTQKHAIFIKTNIHSLVQRVFF